MSFIAQPWYPCLKRAFDRDEFVAHTNKVQNDNDPTPSNALFFYGNMQKLVYVY
jgi:hypothetical protein